MSGLPLRRVTFQFPHGEAPDVYVELVQARHGTIVRKLNLELDLVAGDRLLAYGAGSANAGAAPGAVRSPGRELPAADGFSGFLSEDRLVGQGRTSFAPEIHGQMFGVRMPGA